MSQFLVAATLPLKQFKSVFFSFILHFTVRQAEICVLGPRFLPTEVRLHIFKYGRMYEQCICLKSSSTKPFLRNLAIHVATKFFLAHISIYWRFQKSKEIQLYIPLEKCLVKYSAIFCTSYHQLFMIVW